MLQIWSSSRFGKSHSLALLPYTKLGFECSAACALRCPGTRTTNIIFIGVFRCSGMLVGHNHACLSSRDSVQHSVTLSHTTFMSTLLPQPALSRYVAAPSVMTGHWRPSHRFARATRRLSTTSCMLLFDFLNGILSACASTTVCTPFQRLQVHFEPEDLCLSLDIRSAPCPAVHIHYLHALGASGQFYGQCWWIDSRALEHSH